MERSATAERGNFVRRAAYVALAGWAALCLVIGAILLARHLLTLPTPATGDPALAAALHRERGAARGWLVLHVLYDSCGCSARVLDHLRHTARPPGVTERVVYITDEAAPPALAVELAARGLALDVVAPEQLVARYHLEAAPLLIVIDPDDTVRYLGGYTPRKQAADVRELGVIAATRLGWRVDPLPVFGCAVGRALRAKLNPFE